MDSEASSKGVRFQYWLGVVEFACVDENSARKRWERLTKANPEIASTDYAYSYMALARLDAYEGKIKARTALGFLQRQLAALAGISGGAAVQPGTAANDRRPQGRCRRKFSRGCGGRPPGMVEYLNLDAIRMLDAER